MHNDLLGQPFSFQHWRTLKMQYSKSSDSLAICFPVKLWSQRASAGETWSSAFLLFLLAEQVYTHTEREKCRGWLGVETGCVSSFHNLRWWVQPKKQCLSTNQVNQFQILHHFRAPFVSIIDFNVGVTAAAISGTGFLSHILYTTDLGNFTEKGESALIMLFCSVKPSKPWLYALTNAFPVVWHLAKLIPLRTQEGTGYYDGIINETRRIHQRRF